MFWSKKEEVTPKRTLEVLKLSCRECLEILDYIKYVGNPDAGSGVGQMFLNILVEQQARIEQLEKEQRKTDEVTLPLTKLGSGGVSGYDPDKLQGMWGDIKISSYTQDKVPTKKLKYCRYGDCGFCYAPKGCKTNDVHGECRDPKNCEENK